MSKTLFCDNTFCIYWENQHCLLDSISLDDTGSCSDCICISFPEDNLEQKRLEMREQLDKS